MYEKGTKTHASIEPSGTIAVTWAVNILKSSIVAPADSITIKCPNSCTKIYRGKEADFFMILRSEVKWEANLHFRSAGFFRI